MTILIEADNTKEIKKILAGKLKKQDKKGDLAKHFGKLKRNLDGLQYQNAMREDEG